MNAYMHEKEEREEKCYLKVVVLVVVWAKHCYQILILWIIKKFTLDDLFPIYIFIIPNMNRIMHDPIMKIISFIWPILEYYLRVIMVYALVQQ